MTVMVTMNGIVKVSEASAMCDRSSGVEDVFDICKASAQSRDAGSASGWLQQGRGGTTVASGGGSCKIRGQFRSTQDGHNDSACPACPLGPARWGLFAAASILNRY